MRVIASLAVVAIHVSAPIVLSFNIVGKGAWWFGNFVDSTSRWAVPIFVMISGVLLLDSRKDEPIIIIVRKKFL